MAPRRGSRGGLLGRPPGRGRGRGRGRCPSASPTDGHGGGHDDGHGGGRARGCGHGGDGGHGGHGGDGGRGGLDGYDGHGGNGGDGGHGVYIGDGGVPHHGLPDLTGFEFFVAIYEDSWDILALPQKFADVLNGQEPRVLTLREASGGGRRGWDVEVYFDGQGRMHLTKGWEQFARAHGLQAGHFLKFTYGGEGGGLTVKVFDGTMCRRRYHIDDKEENDDDEE